MKYLLLFFFAACTTKPIYNRGPVKDLLLRPRAGYVGKLTNKRCSERKKRSDVCVKYDVKEFDFNDDETRALLRNLKFVCNVRGERFSPCEKSRGLCQLRRDESGIWPFRKSEVKVNKYISMVDDYQFLIEADTYCASLYSVVGQEMFP